MSNAWILKAILKLVSGLSIKEAHSLLTLAKQKIETEKTKQNTEVSSCSNSFRKPRPTKIDLDEEMKLHILNLPYMYETEILRSCEELFGASRAPSRSGLNRWLKSQRSAK